MNAVKLRSRDKELTFAVTVGGEELRLVAAIFFSSTRPQHFVLRLVKITFVRG
jgi:mRNA-degrading endonuclease HigB of HigAB toxin-antitoxin module